MCDEASEGSASAAEVSDVSDDSASFEATENDELVENAEENSDEEHLDYSDDLLNGEKSDKDTELCDESALVHEKSEKEEAANESESEGKSEKNESAEEDKNSDQQIERAEIYEKSEYSDEINDRISSVEELEIYQKAGLKEAKIDGRAYLVRDDIDMDYVDPKSGKTNKELMEMGRSPYDSKTGEKIQLHHIGQEYDSPLAELTANSEHGQYYSVIHTKESESWRSDEQKNNRYNNEERPQHWRCRAKEG